MASEEQAEPEIAASTTTSSVGRLSAATAARATPSHRSLTEGCCVFRRLQILAEIYFLRLEAVARAEEAIKQRISFRLVGGSRRLVVEMPRRHPASRESQFVGSREDARRANSGPKFRALNLFAKANALSSE
jgi:hypothetical protein